MKSFISAMLLFALMVTGAGLYTKHLEKTLYDFQLQVKTLEASIHKDDWQQSKKQFANLEHEWDEKQTWMKVFIDHRDIEEIETVICEIRGYLAYENAEDALVKTAVLSALFIHLPESESITLNNIL